MGLVSENCEESLTEPVNVGTCMLGMDECTPLFQAAAEATEEAIWNAMIAADTMTGWQNRTVHAVPHDLLKQAVARYARRG